MKRGIGRALVIERDEDIAGADGGIDGAYEQVQEGTIAVTNAMNGLVIWHQPALPCTSQGVYAAGKFLHSTSNFASSQATWNCLSRRVMVKAAPIRIPFGFLWPTNTYRRCIKIEWHSTS